MKFRHDEADFLQSNFRYRRFATYMANNKAKRAAAKLTRDLEAKTNSCSAQHPPEEPITITSPSANTGAYQARRPQAHVGLGDSESERPTYQHAITRDNTLYNSRASIVPQWTAPSTPPPPSGSDPFIASPSAKSVEVRIGGTPLKVPITQLSGLPTASQVQLIHRQNNWSDSASVVNRDSVIHHPLSARPVPIHVSDTGTTIIHRHDSLLDAASLPVEILHLANGWDSPPLLPIKLLPARSQSGGITPKHHRSRSVMFNEKSISSGRQSANHPMASPVFGPSRSEFATSVVERCSPSGTPPAHSPPNHAPPTPTSRSLESIFNRPTRYLTTPRFQLRSFSLSDCSLNEKKSASEVVPSGKRKLGLAEKLVLPRKSTVNSSVRPWRFPTPRSSKPVNAEGHERATGTLSRSRSFDEMLGFPTKTALLRSSASMITVGTRRATLDMGTTPSGSSTHSTVPSISRQRALTLSNQIKRISTFVTRPRQWILGRRDKTIATQSDPFEEEMEDFTSSSDAQSTQYSLQGNNALRHPYSFMQRKTSYIRQYLDQPPQPPSVIPAQPGEGATSELEEDVPSPRSRFFKSAIMNTRRSRAHAEGQTVTKDRGHSLCLPMGKFPRSSESTSDGSTTKMPSKSDQRHRAKSALSTLNVPKARLPRWLDIRASSPPADKSAQPLPEVEIHSDGIFEADITSPVPSVEGIDSAYQSIDNLLANYPRSSSFTSNRYLLGSSMDGQSVASTTQPQNIRFRRRTREKSIPPWRPMAVFRHDIPEALSSAMSALIPSNSPATDLPPPPNPARASINPKDSPQRTAKLAARTRAQSTQQANTPTQTAGNPLTASSSPYRTSLASHAYRTSQFIPVVLPSYLVPMVGPPQAPLSTHSLPATAMYRPTSPVPRPLSTVSGRNILTPLKSPHSAHALTPPARYHTPVAVLSDSEAEVESNGDSDEIPIADLFNLIGGPKSDDGRRASLWEETNRELISTIEQQAGIRI
ncbi:hypothetical protein H4R33_006329 [Dimargaris cristalligena]|nr:hypothetical protein H4R33_006329 [Dimargaris cristalligena]